MFHSDSAAASATTVTSATAITSATAVNTVASVVVVPAWLEIPLTTGDLLLVLFPFSLLAGKAEGSLDFLDYVLGLLFHLIPLTLIL